MVLEHVVKLLASTVLAVFSGVIFMAVIMYKIAEAFFVVLFTRRKTTATLVDTPQVND